MSKRDAEEKAAKLGMGRAAVTIALCADEDTAKCASRHEMRESWKHLKSLAKARRKSGDAPVLALKLQCPGICRFGPIAGVFTSGHPSGSGKWYGGCDPRMIDRLVEAHACDVDHAESNASTIDLESKRIG